MQLLVVFVLVTMCLLVAGAPSKTERPMSREEAAACALRILDERVPSSTSNPINAKYAGEILEIIDNATFGSSKDVQSGSKHNRNPTVVKPRFST